MLGWKTKPLGDVTQFINGLWKGKEPPFVHVGVIRNTNFTKEGDLDDSDIAYLDVEAKKFQKRRLQFGDLILEKSGGGPKQPVGRVVFFDKTEGDFSFSNFTAAIRVADPSALDARFLHKYLHWVYVSGRTEVMQSHSTGIRNLNGDAYKAIKIAYPSLIEQRHIVAILDEAFEGIATAKANAEKNLQNARELFESALDAALSQRDSGYVETTLGDEIDLLAGYAFSSKGYTNDADGIRLLRGDNIMQGYLRWDDAKAWPANDVDPYMRFALREGDVVLAMDRPWVKAGLKRARIFVDDLPCLQLQRTARLRPKQRMSVKFLYHLTGSRSFSGHLLGVQTGLGVPHISGKQIESFLFMLPPPKAQETIASTLDDLQQHSERLGEIHQQKVTALGELKKSLLHQAFTGSLIAKSTDKQLEAVA
ncbi:restriction endonuclease subunit S [Candidatus Accumulibacter phosphatis]|jgi:type I restriction enzyme S subunit|uniref:Restriction endonuclease subunit S n=1 Tax=Candidatus Accumulibacter phosphatis TaxID=327160 RepID=A0ABX1U456_9PROT|nr:restriction endonuclease subunit S [Candidatus Accumulibacter phosphatis]NMQ30114.1 restriction endonuclease subunit S [Candidatus Accumulibacter phosphatis]